MDEAPRPIPINRQVSQPYRKLTRLCQESAIQGGKLKTFAAVAEAVKQHRSRITQLFGYGQESDGSVVPGRTLGEIVHAFKADGVRCELDWFYLEIATFEQRLVEARSDTPESRTALAQVAISADWERRAETVLADLVELSLPPPRAGNEIPDTHYVDATLLFGTAYCDFDPEDGQEPRTVSIALTNARLALGTESYSPLPGTMLGERVESPHFKRVAGGIDITGPAPNGLLHGDPLGGEHLAVIAGTNNGDETFPVTIAANRRSFVVADPDAPPVRAQTNVSANNKNAILNVLIYKNLRKDDANRAVLAQATMRRLRRDTDPVS